MCVFYLVLRALDTVEDDMAVPVAVKVPLLPVTLPVPIVSVWPAVVTSNCPPPAPRANPRV